MAKKKRMTAAGRRAEMQKKRQKQRQEVGATAELQTKITAKKSDISQKKPKWMREKIIQSLEVKHKKMDRIKDVIFSEPVTICVQLLSPIHFGSGQADVNVDAEVIHDDVGLPYFPAKRFKGLLYESALEVVEMSELSGLSLLKRQDLECLFQHGCDGNSQLIVSNLYLPNYAQMHHDWQYLEQNFPAVFQPEDVLEQYTSLRYQTKIDAETGTAADTSLHNMRVVEEGLHFEGKCRIQPGDASTFTILALALRNLSQSGLKRTRGFGHIACTMKQNGKDIMLPLVKKALAQLQEGGVSQ